MLIDEAKEQAGRKHRRQKYTSEEEPAQGIARSQNGTVSGSLDVRSWRSLTLVRE
jgi:hypothetical protein